MTPDPTTPTPAATPPAAPKTKRRGPPRGPRAHDQVHAAKGRLPDQSEFQVHYDAAAQQWTGTLHVPCGIDGVPFTASASRPGVFRLLHALDDQYRAWLRELAQAGPDPHAPDLGGEGGGA